MVGTISTLGLVVAIILGSQLAWGQAPTRRRLLLSSLTGILAATVAVMIVGTVADRPINGSAGVLLLLVFMASSGAVIARGLERVRRPD